MYKRGALRTYILILAFVILFFSLFYSYKNQTSEITGMATTSTQVGNLTVSIATYVSCAWSDAALNVSFGQSLDPGSQHNATLNYNTTGGLGTAYNVTDSLLSNVAVDVKVQGSNLTSGTNKIAVGNITWDSTNLLNTTNLTSTDISMNITNATKLQNSYDTSNLVVDALAIGSTAHYRFWLTIPNGTVAATYTGNYSMQCLENT